MLFESRSKKRDWLSIDLYSGSLSISDRQMGNVDEHERRWNVISADPDSRIPALQNPHR